LTLRRGISVLIGGAFEQLFCPEGREFEQANPQSSNAQRVPGGMLKLQFDRYIMPPLILLSSLTKLMENLGCRRANCVIQY